MSPRHLLDLARLTLLRLRVRIARPLPAVAMVLLRALDRWAAERAVDRPWTAAAADRLDRVLSREDREP